MPDPSAKPSDYESYPWVTRGDDYPAIDLVDPTLRRSTFGAGLDDAESDRVRRLFAENIIISFHDHPQILPADSNDTFAYLRSRHDFTAFSELRSSGLTALFDGLWGVFGMTSPSGWKWEDQLTNLGMRLADLAFRDDACVARTVEDIREAKRNGKLAFVMGTESTAIENELDRIDVAYGFGIRQMGLVYADSNTLGSGQNEPRDAGLTNFGHRAVKRMNDLGIVIDVSHASDLSSRDAIEASSKPIAITHAGARGAWPSPRMKSDDLLRALAERGGVLGLEAAPHSTVSYEHRTHSIESVMDHFTYAVDLMGIEHVTFGPDSFYGDHVGFHEANRGNLDVSKMLSAGDEEYKRVAFVDGLENPSESFHNVAGWLVRHGYSDSEIALVLGGNVLRLLEEVWR